MSDDRRATRLFAACTCAFAADLPLNQPPAYLQAIGVSLRD